MNLRNKEKLAGLNLFMYLGKTTINPTSTMAAPGLTPPLLAPIYLPGQEPMPAGTTPQEREEFRQMMKWQGWMNGAMESCTLKTVLSGGAGMSAHRYK